MQKHSIDITIEHTIRNRNILGESSICLILSIHIPPLVSFLLFHDFFVYCTYSFILLRLLSRRSSMKMWLFKYYLFFTFLCAPWRVYKRNVNVRSTQMFFLFRRFLSIRTRVPHSPPFPSTPSTCIAIIESYFVCAWLHPGKLLILWKRYRNSLPFQWIWW